MSRIGGHRLRSNRVRLPGAEHRERHAGARHEIAGGSLVHVRSARVDDDDGALADHVNAVAAQSDGKGVIGGDFTTVNGTTRNRIARLNSDVARRNSVDALLRPAEAEELRSVRGGTG